MSKPAPGVETLRDAILEALAAGPITKAELAHRLGLHGTSLGGHLATLESRGRILIRAAPELERHAGPRRGPCR